MQMGRVRRGRLGVGGQTVPLPQQLVRTHTLPTDTGVLVTWLQPRSPAQSAGLQERDVLVGFGDDSISSVDDLHRLLTEETIGVRSRLTILRKGQKLDLSVTPTESVPE